MERVLAGVVLLCVWKGGGAGFGEGGPFVCERERGGILRARDNADSTILESL